MPEKPVVDRGGGSRSASAGASVLVIEEPAEALADLDGAVALFRQCGVAPRIWTAREAWSIANST
jgi:hypothetical protein